MLETRVEHENEHGDGECIPIDKHERLQQEHDELQTEVERLRREKRQVLAQREENQELKRYVEDELSWREQTLATRLRWWIFGKEAE
ncbi:hypothetical protein [Haladaptatus halobius]|uniref:hypothetical protein n=1 Tax=Haladaptatus halobius TaxID=2884875 RepID=UPI001D09CF22|nr:hypothetical protein [Haladaptatus halobius]